MRRLVIAMILGSGLATAASLTGCPAAHDDYPGASCKVNADCYQGEICSNASVCVSTQDMAVTGDFAHLSPDLSGGDDMMPSMDDMTPVDL
jgi:hypothetical protein